MTKLQSKLQYKNYEPGEFTAIEEHSLEEVAAIITNYPWGEQRHFTHVGPTCPSITVEDAEGNYLKLGHHYYEKYCLYLLNSDGKFFKKIVPTLDEAIAVFTLFYNGEDFLDGFEHELALHPRRHFENKEFVYRISYINKAFSLVCVSLIPIFFLAILLFLFFTGIQTNDNKDVSMKWIEAIIIFASAFFSFFVIIGWRLFANHYNYTKEQFIEISKGKNEFTFGTDAAHQIYQKDKIVMIKEYLNTKSRNPQSGIKYIEITFADNDPIIISSMLLDYAFTKFPDVKNVKWETVSKNYPMIKKA